MMIDFQTEQQPQMMLPPTIGDRPNYLSQAAFLDTPENRGLLKDAYQAQITNLSRIGPAPSQRGENIATDIFGKIIAPAMAAFGGPGTSAAGIELIGQARETARQARAQRRAEQQNTYDAIKGLNDIAQTGFLKPLSEYTKSVQKAQELGLKQEAQQQKAAYQQGVLSLREKKQQVWQNLQEKALQLKDTHFQAKLKQTKAIADEVDKRVREIAILNARMRKYGLDQASADRKAQLLTDAQRDYQKYQAEAAKFNSQIAARLQEKDTKTGTYRFADAQGNPLNPADFQITLGSDQQSDSGEEPKEDDVRAAMSEIRLGLPPQLPELQQQAASPAGRFKDSHRKKAIEVLMAPPYRLSFQEAVYSAESGRFYR